MQRVKPASERLAEGCALGEGDVGDLGVGDAGGTEGVGDVGAVDAGRD